MSPEEAQIISESMVSGLLPVLARTAALTAAVMALLKVSPNKAELYTLFEAMAKSAFEIISSQTPLSEANAAGLQAHFDQATSELMSCLR